MSEDHGHTSAGTPADTPSAGKIETVLMSGGAPNSPLMAGFLYALLEEGKMFKYYHTAGAGTLMALLSLSPTDSSIAAYPDPDPAKTEALKQRRAGEGKALSHEAAEIRRRGMKALKAWIDAGVSDEVYQRFPINFKLFHKPGPFSPLFNRLAQRYKLDDPDTPSDDDPFKRLRNAWLGRLVDTAEKRRVYNDLVDLAFVAASPSTLSMKSKGLAAHLPFLDDIVDFKQLREDVPIHLCVNAFNMAIGEMKQFHREEIDSQHIRAAFSMPFIYPPAQIGTDYYSEGADHEPINFKPLIEEREEAWERELGPLHNDREAIEQERDTLKKELNEVLEEFARLNAALPGAVVAGLSIAELQSGIQAQAAKAGEIGQKLEGVESRFKTANEKIDRELEVKLQSHLHRVVLLDVMGSLSEYLVRPPRGLYDAYVISIMTPVVALAKKQIEYFKVTQQLFEAEHGYRHFELIEVGYTIPSYAQPYVMDWSRSNLEILFDVGYKTGKEFFEKHNPVGALLDIEDAWTEEEGEHCH